MYLITAYFDDNTNKELQRLIDRIAVKTGNTFMAGAGLGQVNMSAVTELDDCAEKMLVSGKVPPHMTICQIEARNEDVLKPAFEALRGKVESGEIFIASTGQLFPYVMFAAPVMNKYLQNLSETVYNEVKDITETSVSHYYMPYSWLPHITLGKTLSKEQMASAFEVLQEGFVPITGQITAIGLSKVNPHTDVARIELVRK